MTKTASATTAIAIAIAILSCAGAFTAPFNTSPPPSRGGTILFYREGNEEMDTPTTESTTRRRSFQQRMRASVLESRTMHKRPQNAVETVESLQDFAETIHQARRDHTMVVVRFHGEWCPLCRKLRPLFDKAAQNYPDLKFVDISVGKNNANLHQILGIDSVPFAQIYHPERGLVHERKLTRRNFRDFLEVLGSQQGDLGA